MTNKSDIQRVARQMAAELLVIELLAHHYLRFPNAKEAAAKHRAYMRKIIDQQAVAGLDPALSALVVGELGDAIDEMIAQAQDAALRIAGRDKSNP